MVMTRKLTLAVSLAAIAALAAVAACQGPTVRGFKEPMKLGGKVVPARGCP